MCRYCKKTPEHYFDRNGNDIGCDICVEWWDKKDAREWLANGGALVCPVCGKFEPMELYVRYDECVGCTSCVTVEEIEVEPEFDENNWIDWELENRRNCRGTAYEY